MKNFSAFSLGMFGRCQVQFMYRYIERQIRPPQAAIMVGSGAHSGFEAGMRTKANTGENETPGNVRDAAVAGFDSRVQTEDVALTPDEAKRGRQLVMADCRDRVAAMAHYWACTAQLDYMPAGADMIEHRFRIPLPKYDAEFGGIIDLMDDQGRVIDWKTTGRRMPSQADVDQSQQLSGYALAAMCRQESKSEGCEVRLDVIQEGAGGTKRKVLAGYRSRASLDVFLRRTCVTIRAIRAAIETGDYLPCPGGSWCCSPAWCGWWGTCRFVNRKGG